MRDTSLDLWLSRMTTCFGEVKDEAILDFGSGCGHKAILLALCGARVTAVEIDPAAVEQTRNAVRQVGVDLEVILGGTGHLAQLQTASFDRVLLSEVFEHLTLEEVTPFVAQLARVLQPGGKLFLTTPNCVCYGPAERAKEYYLRQAYGHHKHYSLAELQAFFDRPPFRLREYYFETHPLTLWRNRLFYPVAVYDYAIQSSLRYPALRFLMRPFSALAYWLWESSYPITRALFHRYENKRMKKEKTGLTIMLDIERC